MTHLAIVGPTASGKSALGLEVAEKAGDIEIVSVDSMQIYRSMDIGTAKATKEQQSQVPHHMIDVADPSENWSVAQFQQAARDAIREIEDRGHRALLVGGTGLHYHAVVDDLRFPPQDLSLRSELEEAVATEEGLAAAYEELQSVDPQAASKIEPNNARRIVRALEVIRITGMPFSASGPGVASFENSFIEVRAFGVRFPPNELANRIESRIDNMRATGLTDEVKRLASEKWSRVARQAIGYKEILAYLSGDYSEDEAYEEIVSRTHKLSRRQRAWFRRDPRIEWFDEGSELLPALL